MKPANDKYEVVKKLGLDGPFVVQLAWPREGGGAEQSVLLKRLRPGMAPPVKALKAFVEDTVRLSAVVHPNVVRVLDLGMDQEGIFLATEHVHGLSLAALLRRLAEKKTCLQPDLAVAILLQACSGLNAAQGAKGLRGGETGVVHGALGASSVLITFDGVVKLKDFGIHHFGGMEAASPQLPAGPRLSPEQRLGGSPDFRSDLFCLAELFLGSLGLEPGGKEGNHAPGALLETLGGKLGEQLRTVLLRCLEQDPDRRWSNAHELLQALSGIIDPKKQKQLVRRMAQFLRDSVGRKQSVPPPTALSPIQEPQPLPTSESQEADAVRPPPSVDPGSESLPLVQGPGPSPEYPDENGYLDPASFWGSESPADVARLSKAVEAAPVSSGPSVPLPPETVDEDTAVVVAGPITRTRPALVRQPAAPSPSGPPLAPGVSAKPPQEALPGKPGGLEDSFEPLNRRQWIRVVASVAGAILVAGGLGWWLFGGNTRQGTSSDGDAGMRITADAASTGGPGAAANLDGNGEAPVGAGVDGGLGDAGQGSTAEVSSLSGSLIVSSVPTGALVTVNGEKVGTTPATLKGIADGATLTLQVEMEGYQVWNKSLLYRASDPPPEIRADLTQKMTCGLGTGWIYLTSSPAVANVVLDGEVVATKLPAIINSVCAGEMHSLVVKASGYKIWTKQVQISPNEVLNLNLQLSH